jgi:methionine synthase II (cobalamin-independent)
MFRPFSTTGIGSLPHLDADEACGLVLRGFDIPFWPQLPKVSFLESMIPQFSEGMPFVRINRERETIFVRRDESDELERFYEGYQEESRIAISEDYARGFYCYLRAVRTRHFGALKGQITGPLTFTLGIKDSEGRLLYFDEELRQISLMLLQAKARWQIDQLKHFADEVIIFIDEPILSAIGSTAYLGVSAEETLRLLKEMADAIKGSGGIPGIHCCGNADWPLVIESGVQILNFDAYNYFDNFLIFHEEVTKFLEGGGYLAWGIIPTTDDIAKESPETIIDVFQERLDALSKQVPRNTLLSRSLLTPSCGAGSRTISEAVKVLQLLIRLKEEFS